MFTGTRKTKFTKGRFRAPGPSRGLEVLDAAQKFTAGACLLHPMLSKDAEMQKHAQQLHNSSLSHL
jgi:hypothetical protein